jgi:hypothetical protein
MRRHPRELINHGAPKDNSGEKKTSPRIVTISEYATNIPIIQLMNDHQVKIGEILSIGENEYLRVGPSSFEGSIPLNVKKKIKP